MRHPRKEEGMYKYNNNAQVNYQRSELSANQKHSTPMLGLEAQHAQ